MKSKLNTMLEKTPNYIKDSSISLKSKILRLLGYAIIGNPNINGLSKDFYDMPADREMPNPKFFNQDALVKNVKTNNIRRQILAKTSRFCFSALMLMFISVVGLILVKGINTSLPDDLNQIEDTKSNTSKNKMGLRPCNQVLDIYYYGKRQTLSKQDIIRCNADAE